MWNAKDVYYVSDSTALLAEETGRSLLCQFPGITFNEEKIPFVRTREKAEQSLAHILENSGGRSPLVFCTAMDSEIRGVFDTPEVEFFDIFGRVLDQLEFCLEATPLREPGFSRQTDNITLARKVEAIDYSIKHDDGTRIREYDSAEVILLGVSRSGKTPVSIYIATHLGLKAANFPLTEEYLDRYELPSDIIRNRKKVVGLTTSALLLHRIREQRYQGSKYAKLSTCTAELAQAGQIYQKYGLPVTQTEGRSIEETAARVIQLLGIKRKR